MDLSHGSNEEEATAMCQTIPEYECWSLESSNYNFFKMVSSMDNDFFMRNVIFADLFFQRINITVTGR